MKKLTILMLIVVCFFNRHYAQQDLILAKSFVLHSKTLNEDRTILIHLPASYHIGNNKYPVIYLLDAETHFSYSSGIVDFFSRFGNMPESILIGIANTNRNRDFTPSASDELAGSGGADNFIKFMKNELFDYVNSNYRTYDYRTLIGHSLCGMFCFYTLFSEPGMFNSFIAISPWFIYDKNFMHGFSENALKKINSLEKSIYFTAGSAEQPDLIAGMDRYVELLKTTAPGDLRWTYKLMEGDDHSSLLLMSIYDGLKNVYSGWRIPDSVLIQGLGNIETYYYTLSDRFGYEVKPSEVTINAAGYYFLQRNNFEEAIKIFKRNIELYPLSANVYDSRGEAYERSGNLNAAKADYENACEAARKNNDPNLNIFNNNLERVTKLLKNLK